MRAIGGQQYRSCYLFIFMCQTAVEKIADHVTIAWSLKISVVNRKKIYWKISTLKSNQLLDQWIPIQPVRYCAGVQAT